MRSATIKTIIFLAVLSVMATAAWALEAPHDPAINCNDCHNNYMADRTADSGGNFDNTSTNMLCRDCHKAGGSASEKAYHSSQVTDTTNKYGLWTTECIQCHDPHMQKNFNAARNINYDGTASSGSKLASGTITGIAGNVVSVSHTGTWSDGQWTGYYLRAGSPYFDTLYIVNSNNTTLYTKSNVDTAYVTTGAPFSIGYGKLLRSLFMTNKMIKNSSGVIYDASTSKTVKLYNTSGAYSPSESLTSTNAACVVCHTKTSQFNIGYATQGDSFDNIIAGYASGGHANKVSSSKSCWTDPNCHKMPKEGFSVGCDYCHGNPPIAANSLIKYPATEATGRTSAGAHQKHDAYGYDCTYCHYNGGRDQITHTQGTNLDMAFFGMPKRGGAYNGPAIANVPLATGDVGYTTVGPNANRLCSNIYCHSDGTNYAGTYTYQQANWNTVGTTCVSCHGTGGTYAINDRHPAHASAPVTGRLMRCAECHGNTVNISNAIISNALHVNGLKDVAWGNIASGSSAYSRPNCNNNYCHSNGQGGAPMTAVMWNASTAVNCYTCHDDANPTSTNLSGAHAAHVNTSGNAYACTKCHSQVVSGPTTIVNAAWHINKIANVDGAQSYSANKCNNSMCHGSNSPTWTTNLTAYHDCTKCHGELTANPSAWQNAPGGAGFDTNGDSAGGDPQVGAHQTHLRGLNNYSRPVDCDECHNVPATINATGHIDTILPAEVTFSAGSLARKNSASSVYNTTNRKCYNVYCHGGAMWCGSSDGSDRTPLWSNTNFLNGSFTKTGDCDKCHNAPPASGTHTGAEAIDQCYTCHDSVESTGTSFANKFMHVDGGLQVTSDKPCDFCHGNPPSSTNNLLGHYNTGSYLNSSAFGTGRTTAGAHMLHNAIGLGACTNCHNNGFPNNHRDVADYVVLGFKDNPPAGYPAVIGFYNSPLINAPYSVQYDAATARAYSSGGQTTQNCNNIWCHSDGNTLGTAQFKQVIWNDTFTMPTRCAKCHGNGAGTYVTTGYHLTHTGAGYTFKCVECHAATTTAANTVDYAQNTHVDGINQVSWWANGLANGASAYVDANTGCSNNYCHSQGDSFAVSYASPMVPATWTGGTLGCNGCHGGIDGVANTITADAHRSHVTNAAVLGRKISCNTCHATVVDGSNAITNKSLHVNRAYNVGMSNGASTCTNYICHSNGNYDGTMVYNNHAWTNTIGCLNCHGNGSDKTYPYYADGNNGNGQSNSHNKHIVSSMICGDCHEQTSYGGTALNGTNIANHVNQTIDIAFRKGGWYNGVNESCNSTYCHGNGQSPAWGVLGGTACNSCHSGNSALPAGHDVHYNSTTLASTALIANAEVRSTSGNYIYSCGVCHKGGMVQHAGGAVQNNIQSAEIYFFGNIAGSGATYTPGGSAAGNDNGFEYTNGSCSSIYCHSNGANTGRTYQSITWTASPLSCSGCHVAQPSTGVHNAHVIDSEHNLRCDACHANAMDNVSDTTIADKAVHVNTTIDVVYNSINTGGAAYVNATTTCNNNYCHSLGDSLGSAYNTPVVQVTWGGGQTLGCNGCHGGIDGVANTITSKAHQEHVSNAAVLGRKLSCDTCHANTVNGSNNITGWSLHVNRTYNIAMSNGASTCTNYICHSNGNVDGTLVYNNPAWTQTNIGCFSCHGNGTVGYPVYADGNNGTGQSNSHYKHVGSSIRCDECHTSVSGDGAVLNGSNIALHVNNTIDVAFRQGGNYTNGTEQCTSTYCHGTGSSPAWGTIGGTDCQSCHSGNAQLPGGHDVHYNTVTLASTALLNAANNSSSSAYLYSCGVCHQGSQIQHAAGKVSTNRAAEIYFNGTIAGNSAGYAEGSLAGSDKGFNYSNGTCTSVYCHSDGNSTTIAYKTATWPGTPMGCTGCHTAQPNSDIHNAHVIDGEHNIKCSACHATTMNATNDSLIANKNLHVNKAVNVVYNSLNAGASAYVNKTTNCTNGYCHSRGDSLSNVYNAAIVANITWGSGTTLGCNGCHGGYQGISNVIVTKGHNSHVVQNTLVGRNLSCNTCHANTVNVSNVITGWSLHVNKTYNIAMSNGASTCTNYICHSNGNYDGTLVYNNPTWSANPNLACYSCHGNGTSISYPTYADGNNGNGQSNSHNKHNAASNECHECHWQVSGNGSVLNGIDITKHVDNNVDVMFMRGGTYSNATEQCTSTYCHGNGSAPAWGTVGGTNCGSCHSGNANLPGGHDVHYNSTTLATGAMFNASVNSTTSAYIFSCGACHQATQHAAGKVNTNRTAQVTFNTVIDGGSATYVNGGSIFAYDNGFSFTNGTCSSTYCHSNGNVGGANTPVYNSNMMWGTVGPLSCGSCHQAQPTTGKHVLHVSNAVIDSPRACDTCHKNSVSGSTAVTNKIAHVDRVKTVSMNTLFGGAYNGVGCSSVACHSTGRYGNSPSYAYVPWTMTRTNGCNFCHGTGTGAVGNAGTDLSGSHIPHIQTAANTCNDCHSTVTTTVANAINNANHINLSINVVPSAANGGAFSHATQRCTNNNCHGSRSPIWNMTANDSSLDHCTVCHGTRTTGADGTTKNAFATQWRVAPGNGGVDTNGDSAATDTEVGAHYPHLSNINGYFGGMPCSDCHVVPTQPKQGNHMNGVSAEVIFSNSLITNAGTLTPYFNPSTHTCANVYCHGVKMPNGDKLGVDNMPAWTNTSYIAGNKATMGSGACSGCHGDPPTPAGTHSTVTNRTQCNGCHTHVATNGSFVDPSKHIDGQLQAAGFCDSCHQFPPSSTESHFGAPNANGVHMKHYTHLQNRSGYNQGLTYTESYGDAKTTALCGPCHSMASSDHSTTNGTATNRQIIVNATWYRFSPSYLPKYNGIPGSASTTKGKTCSGVNCHYKTTPDWDI